MSIQLNSELSRPHTTHHTRHRIRIHLVEAFDAFKAVRHEWETLTAASEEYPLYLTYPYCELAAARVIDKGGRVVVVMVYDDNDLLAIWPLEIQRKGVLRVAKVMTCGNGEEYGGPLVRGKATLQAVTECVRAVMQVQADVLEVPFVQDGSLLQQALEGAPQSWVSRLLPERLSVFPGYSVCLSGFPKWEDFAGTLSQSLRRNLRRYRKGLGSIGETEFGWCTTHDDAVAVLTWLFANKRRWAETRGLNTKYLMDDEVRDFFGALAQRTDLATTPLVAFVKVNGVPVAASINLVGPRKLEYWIFTYDEAYSRYSVGNLLTEFVAKWAHANGRDFDMRTFYNEYKTHWVNLETRHRTRVVVLGVRGRVMEIPLLSFQIVRMGRRLEKTLVSGLGNIAARAARVLRAPAPEEVSRDAS